MVPSFAELPLLAFVHVFCLTGQDVSFLETKGIQQPFILKMLGILFRNQRMYLWRPLVFDPALKDNTSYWLVDPALWCWRAWYALFEELAIFRLHRAPHCFRCLLHTAAICKQCKKACTALGLRPIPTCATCVRCLACDFEMNNPAVSPIALRYSFFLTGRAN